MKPIVTFLLALVLGVSSCGEDDVYPKSDNYRLLKILHFSSSSSIEPGSGLEFTYATNGNLIKETLIDYPNTISTYKIYEYSGDRLTKVKIFDGEVGNLTLGTYRNYFYADDHVTKEELRLADGTLKYSTFYEYRGKDLVNTYKESSELGIHHQYKYSFDVKGRLVLEEVFMYDRELSEFMKYFYDDRDRIMKIELYNQNSTLTSYVEKTYDGSNSLPAQELLYDQNGLLMQTKLLTYDSWGNLVGCNIEGQGVSCQVFHRKYNGQLLMEEIKYFPEWGCTEWTVTRYEYEKK